ncbi:MAG: multicopper oxidase domain-containing protein, partial [Thermodesulfobacteriota bacterium]
MKDKKDKSPNLSRRNFLVAGGIGTAALAGAFTAAEKANSKQQSPFAKNVEEHYGLHSADMAVGTVDSKKNGFDPAKLLYDFDYGKSSKLGNRQTLREYNIVAVDQEIEIAPGVMFPAWSYNARVPGPAIRCIEGDRLRITFTNHGSHPHTIHFHSIHPASMDGVPGIGAGIILPGKSTVYEFDAYPFGCHLYHCHSVPLKR